jgi:hypothetical protein
LAKYYGVTLRTLQRTLDRNPDLAALTYPTAQEVIRDLENVIFLRAMGKFKTREVITKSNGTEVVKTVEKEPDIGALKWLLCNLAPERWKIDPEMVRIREKELELKREQSNLSSPEPRLAIMRLRDGK